MKKIFITALYLVTISIVILAGNFTFEKLAEDRNGVCGDFCFSGDYVYAANGANVEKYVINNDKLYLVCTYSTGREIERMRVSEPYVYIELCSTIYRYNMNTDDVDAELSIGSVRNYEIHGDYIICAMYKDDEVVIYDKSLHFVRKVENVHSDSKIFIEDNRLLMHYDNEILIYDISDISNWILDDNFGVFPEMKFPILAGKLIMGASRNDASKSFLYILLDDRENGYFGGRIIVYSGSLSGLAYSDSILYVMLGDTCKVYDISDFNNITLIGSQGGNYRYDGVKTSENYAGINSGLCFQLFNITSPLDEADKLSNYSYSVTTYGDDTYCFRIVEISEFESRLDIYSINDLINGKMNSLCAFKTPHIADLIIEDSKIWTAGNHSVCCIDVSDPYAPEIIEEFACDVQYATGMAKRENVIAISDLYNGLYIYTLTPGKGLQLQCNYPIQPFLYDVSYHQDKLVTFAHRHGNLRIFDISNLSRPILEDSFTLKDTYVYNYYLDNYVGAMGDYLSLDVFTLNVEDMSNIEIKDSIHIGAKPNGIICVNNNLLVSTDTLGLLAYELAGKTLTDSYKSYAGFSDISRIGDIVILNHQCSGFTVLRLNESFAGIENTLTGDNRLSVDYDLNRITLSALGADYSINTSIIDLLGRKINNLGNISINANTTYDIETSELRSGRYFLMLQYNNTNQSYPFTIFR